MPQIPVTNRFYRGIDSDTSYTERDGQTYIDAQNIRLVRRDGGTLWACSIGSTEELFDLPIGYVPVGHVYHRGVLFLVIHNETTGYSQIGCYPSVDPTTYQYQRVYRPVMFTKQAPWEYISGDPCDGATVPVLQPLQTNQLGISLDNALGMEARGEADDSVTLYWTDGNTPIRLANTCFNIVTGRPTGRYMSERELISGQWDLVNENANHPKYTLLGVSSGGALKAGHTFITMRYTDTQYGSTSFLSISAPIPIFNTTGNGIPTGGKSDDSTDKQISMLLTGLDIDAALIEIAVVRYTSNSEYEAYLIATRYKLNGTGTLQVTITGQESRVPLAIDEVIALKPYDARVSFCMEQLNNTLYIANTTGRQLDHPDLRQLACLLYLDEHTETLGTIKPIQIGQLGQMYGRDQSDVFNRVGYFSAETYSFCILPVLRGGFYGLPIPVHGTDHYTGTSVGTNSKGIFRFSRTDVVPYHDGSNAIGKAIKMLSGNATVQSFIASSQWINDNVEGFYICRCERRDNMLYQGLHLYAFNGNIARRYQQDAPGYPASVDETYSDYISPLFDPATYGVLFGKDHGGFAGTSDVAGFTYYSGKLSPNNNIVAANKSCIVSTDYSIGKRTVPSTVHVRRIQRTSYAAWQRKYDSNGNNNVLTKSQIDPSVFHYNSQNYQSPIEIDVPSGNERHFVGYDQDGVPTWDTDNYNSEAVDVQAWSAVPTGEGRFVSRREEGTDAQQDGFYYINPSYATFPERNKDISLPIANPSYIGIEQAPSSMFPFSNGATWNHAVVGVYRADPDNITIDNYYEPIAEFYYPIGDYIPLSQFALSDHIRWQGDCFIGRSYTRLVSGHTESIGSELLDLIAQKEAVFDPFYPRILLERGWGYWVSYVAEHRYNPQYRMESGRNLYYPASGVGDEGNAFAWQLDAPESDLYNTSYQRMLAGRGLLPLDPLQPLSAGRFGSRIRASFTHVTGAVSDGYRKFAEVDKIDMDYSKGDIYALVAMNEHLYSVQESAINLHPINERSTSSTDKGTTFITGGLQKLPPYRTYVSDKVGTQHRYGVCAGITGLHGFDYRRRIWWRVQGTMVEDMTITRKAQSWLYRHIVAPLLSDRVADRPDRPLRRSGVQMVSNGEYGEVWLTLYNPTPTTITYSELLDVFQSRVTVAPTLYTPMGKELISFNGDNHGVIHDSTASSLLFYGMQQQASIMLVCGVNGEVVKHWDALILNQNNTSWKEIRYETQHQRAIQVFNNPTEFWYKPRYREMQWKQSIRRADTAIEPQLSIYGANSPMHGQYIIIELVYEDSKNMWLREVIAQVTPSKA